MRLYRCARQWGGARTIENMNETLNTKYTEAVAKVVETLKTHNSKSDRQALLGISRIYFWYQSTNEHILRIERFGSIKWYGKSMWACEVVSTADTVHANRYLAIWDGSMKSDSRFDMVPIRKDGVTYRGLGVRNGKFIFLSHTDLLTKIWDRYKESIVGDRVWFNGDRPCVFLRQGLDEEVYLATLQDSGKVTQELVEFRGVRHVKYELNPNANTITLIRETENILWERLVDIMEKTEVNEYSKGRRACFSVLNGHVTKAVIGDIDHPYTFGPEYICTEEQVEKALQALTGKTALEIIGAETGTIWVSKLKDGSFTAEAI